MFSSLRQNKPAGARRDERVQRCATACNAVQRATHAPRERKCEIKPIRRAPPGIHDVASLEAKSVAVAAARRRSNVQEQTHPRAATAERTTGRESFGTNPFEPNANPSGT